MQQIMLHNTISRQEAEFRDLMEGLEEFGILTFLRGDKETVLPLLFPRISAAMIDKEAVKCLIQLEEEDASFVPLLELLKQYIAFIANEKNGKEYCQHQRIDSQFEC